MAFPICVDCRHLDYKWYAHEGAMRHASPPYASSTSIWWSSKSHPRKAPAEPQDDGAQDNEGHVVGLEHALVDGLVKATRARADNLAADNRPGTAAHVQDTRPGKVIVTYVNHVRLTIGPTFCIRMPFTL